MTFDQDLSARRRQLFRLAVAAGTLGASGALGWLPSLARAARPYPAEPIRVIVPFGVGGLADITMRLVSSELTQRFGDHIVIDNRPGAGGVVAANATLNASHDGYTITLFANGTAIAKSLFKLSFDPERDFVPISTIAYFDLLVLTRANGPYRKLSDVLDAAKQRALTIGTINPGSTQNLSGELFKSTAKLNATVIPYKNTGDVVTALIRGDIDIGMESYAAVKGPLLANQIRALATTSGHRTTWLPNVPTVDESGVKGYEVTGWNALYAPRGVPQEAIDTLVRQLNTVLQVPDIQSKLADLGMQGKSSTPQEMAQIFHRDAQKWAAVIKQAGIKAQ